MLDSFEYKQFLRKNHLIYSPRTRFSNYKLKSTLFDLKLEEKDQKEITKHFDPFTINTLKEEFHGNQNELDKKQVWIIN